MVSVCSNTNQFLFICSLYCDRTLLWQPQYLSEVVYYTSHLLGCGWCLSAFCRVWKSSSGPCTYLAVSFCQFLSGHQWAVLWQPFPSVSLTALRSIASLGSHDFWHAGEGYSHHWQQRWSCHFWINFMTDLRIWMAWSSFRPSCTYRCLEEAGNIIYTASDWEDLRHDKIFTKYLMRMRLQ